MQEGLLQKKQVFNSPEEELNFLREQIKHKEREIETLGAQVPREKIIDEEVTKFKSLPHDVVSPQYAIYPIHVEGYTLNLAPETHDRKVEELLNILSQRGLKNTFKILDGIADPHLTDDFHRALVELIKKGFEPTHVGRRNPFGKSLYMSLFEVIMPDERSDKEQALKEMISSMEQFYAGMLAISPEKKPGENHFTVEIANSNYSEEFIFYVSVPTSKKDLFEKNILSIFPGAKVGLVVDDYNIFNEEGVTVASYAVSKNNPIFPLKTYEQFDHDPLNGLLNSFSKIKRDGEGAAVQLIFQPAGGYYYSRYTKALESIRNGAKVKDAIHMPDGFWEMLFDAIKGLFKRESTESSTPGPIDETAVENIRNKLSTPIVSTNIRIIASAENRHSAEEIISHIESSFHQFENTTGNRISFSRVKDKKLFKFLKRYTFRVFNEVEKIPLNIKEVTSIFHFQNKGVSSIAQLKRTKAGEAPAPVGLKQNGVLLGVNRFRGVETPIYMSPEDRLRHMYVIGQTGTGKTTLLKNMIVQDIRNGAGLCMIDPHGVDIVDILGSIPPERYKDVIYFDPGYTERPMALNMLEYDPRFPDQKTFVVNELFSIFQKLYSNVPESMGPMFEQYFRNAAMLVIEDPETGSTLLDVSRIFTNKQFRDLKISKCKNPVVKEFWTEIATKTSGEASLANFAPYITNKFDIFLANEIMRPIVSQEKSAFDFREIMDSQKILLVNLAKGKLGDINANLIGLIMVGKILMAALSRVDLVGTKFSPFYLYIDEFQNVTTNSIATILSEARKYGLGLNIAHQFIAQLQDDIRDAVFGNVGSIATFRLGADDAEYLEKQFEPVFSAYDIMNVDNRKAYIKMLADGRPVKPFSIETLPPPPTNMEVVKALKEASYQKYGGNRAEIEAQIRKKYEVEKPKMPEFPTRTLS